MVVQKLLMGHDASASLRHAQMALAVQLDDGDVGKSVAQWRSDGVGRLGKVQRENSVQGPRVLGQNKFK